MKRVLLLILVISMLAPLNTVTADTQPTTLEIEVHRLINDVRADKDMHGEDLLPLKLHSVLIKVARDHSQDMLNRDYFDHVNPEGERPADRVSDAGVEWNSVGENLFWASGYSEEIIAETAVDGWVDSPGHYANIITGYSYTGIGIARSGDTYYITQVFITADPNHLEEIGTIYDNNELDNLPSSQEENAGFSFTITTDMAIIGIVIMFVLIGIDAGRRNRQSYGRRF